MINKTLADSATNALKSFQESNREKLDSQWEAGYIEGLEEGISKTIWSLFEFSKNEDKMVNVLNLLWDIPASDARVRISVEKANYACSKLMAHLSSLGWTQTEIEDYIRRKKVNIKVRKDSKFTTMFQNPKELYELLEECD